MTRAAAQFKFLHAGNGSSSVWSDTTNRRTVVTFQLPAGPVTVFSAVCRRGSNLITDFSKYVIIGSGGEGLIVERQVKDEGECVGMELQLM